MERSSQMLRAFFARFLPVRPSLVGYRLGIMGAEEHLRQPRTAAICAERVSPDQSVGRIRTSVGQRRRRAVGFVSARHSRLFTQRGGVPGKMEVSLHTGGFGCKRACGVRASLSRSGSSADPVRGEEHSIQNDRVQGGLGLQRHFHYRNEFLGTAFGLAEIGAITCGHPGVLLYAVCRYGAE